MSAPDLYSMFPGRLTLNVAEAAPLVGVSETHYIAGVDARTLPGQRTGPRRVVVPLFQLDAFLRGCWTAPSESVLEHIRVVTGIGGDR